MLRFILVFVVAVAVRPAVAEFSNIIVNDGGEDLEASEVNLLDPLVFEYYGFIDGVFTALAWTDRGNGYEPIYDSRVGLPAGEDNAIPNFVELLGAAGKVYAVSSYTTPEGNRGEGFIGVLGQGGFTQFAPGAREALGGGAASRFHYRFAKASGNGEVLAAVGYDVTFPHFIVRVTAGNVEILARESVTTFPGSGMPFTRFAAALHINEDGSAIVFRGQNGSGVSGVFLWTSAGGVEKVADTTTVIPGTSDTFNGLFDSTVPSALGPDGTVYLLNSSPLAITAYKDGVLETIVQGGDLVGGEPVFQVYDVLAAPNGDVFIEDGGVRVLRFSNGAWSVFQQTFNTPAPDGKLFGTGFSITEDGAYFSASEYDQSTGTTSASLYRRSLDGATFERVFDFPAEPFGANYNGTSRVQIAGDRVLLDQRYLGLKSDLMIGNGGGTDGFSAYVADLLENLRGPSDDADGDGISNALEYLLGLDSSAPDSGTSAFQHELRTGESLGLEGDSNRYLTLEVRVRADISDASLAPQAAQVLAGLAEGSGDVVQVGSPVQDGDFLVLTYRSVFTVESAQQGFMMLAVSLQE